MSDESSFDDSHWVEDLAWPEVGKRLAAGTLALLPIGAASKEHGLHLPNGTDAIQAVHYADAVARVLDVLVWPVSGYGYYPVFTEYPGSVSLARETFEAMTNEILDGIAAAGASRVVVLNTGISTIAPLEAVLRERAAVPPVRLVNCYAGTRFARAVAEVGEQAFGGHADEIETALMLAIAPHRVALSRARAAQHRIERGMFNRTRPEAPNFSPTGVNGDPTLATVAKGRRLLAALIADITEEIRAFACP